MRLLVSQSSENRHENRARYLYIYPRTIYSLFNRINKMRWRPSLERLPQAPALPPPPEEEDPIIASPADFEKYCIRAGGMALWPPPPTLSRFCTIGVFLEQIAKVLDKIDERIWNPEVKLYELGNLAAVWAPFRSKINGVVNHVGVELFVLHKLNGEWKVTRLDAMWTHKTRRSKS
ncbi:hypothetical protein BDV23DRAFT_174802 [Aspergillus alliaceus]|uniref:Uncharacterized protein n=1 Tax=Petromyces alliaceus TaxID=209559 RepID=A0A5N7C0E3_PETAA|nr:hypothetical protein BDV23DRAFT_174802 [Aspergillus alliaceus]